MLHYSLQYIQTYYFRNPQLSSTATAPTSKISCRTTGSTHKTGRSVFLITEYLWVYCEGNKLFCHYCVESKKHNVFTSGCPKFKKDALKKHVVTVNHRAAVAVKAGRKDMQVAVATAHKSHERSVIAVLQLVYFMAKKNLPSDCSSDLKQLLISQVCFLY